MCVSCTSNCVIVGYVHDDEACARARARGDSRRNEREKSIRTRASPAAAKRLPVSGRPTYCGDGHTRATDGIRSVSPLGPAHTCYDRLRGHNKSRLRHDRRCYFPDRSCTVNPASTDHARTAKTCPKRGEKHALGRNCRRANDQSRWPKRQRHGQVRLG